MLDPTHRGDIAVTIGLPFLLVVVMWFATGGLANASGTALPWQDPRLGGDPVFSGGFWDGFSNPTLNPDWTWVNPLGDCSYSLTASPGRLRLSAPDGGHDLYMNLNAPRLVQPVTGDFVATTKVTIHPTYNYQGAGLLVWQDEGNYIRLERTLVKGIDMWHRAAGTYDGVEIPFSNPTVHLRIQRLGNSFTTWYSETGLAWIEVSTISYPADGTLQVGLVLINEWQDHPVVADFDFFHLAQTSCAITELPLHLQGEPSTPSTLPNHPPWYADTYGNYPDGDNYNTVGRWGCCLSSSSMIVSFFGQSYQPAFTTDPGRLNSWMRGRSGYSRNAVIYAKVMEYAFNNGVALVLQKITVRDDSMLGTHLCNGNPAMLAVRCYSDPECDNQVCPHHYVVATGNTRQNDTDTFTINDPAYGYTTLADSYNNSYCRAYYYLAGPGVLDRSSLQVFAHSPVHLLMTDPEGRRAGYDPRDSTEWEDIPNASYSMESIASSDGSQLPGVKMLFVPQPITGTYQLEIIGYGTGPFEVDVIKTAYEGETTFENFSGEATPGLVEEHEVKFLPQDVYLPIIVKND